MGTIFPAFVGTPRIWKWCLNSIIWDCSFERVGGRAWLAYNKMSPSWIFVPDSLSSSQGFRERSEESWTPGEATWYLLTVSCQTGLTKCKVASGREGGGRRKAVLPESPGFFQVLSGLKMIRSEQVENDKVMGVTPRCPACGAQLSRSHSSR